MVFVDTLPYLLLAIGYMLGIFAGYILGASRVVKEKKQEEPDMRGTPSPVLTSLHTLQDSANNLSVLAKQLIETHGVQLGQSVKLQTKTEYQNG